MKTTYPSRTSRARPALLIAGALSIPLVAVWGCSTSNVHPSTYGDCLGVACAPAAPTGRGDGPVVGQDGGAAEAGIGRQSNTACRDPVDMDGNQVDSQGNAVLQGRITVPNAVAAPPFMVVTGVFVIDAGAVSTSVQLADGGPGTYTWRLASVAVGKYKVGGGAKSSTGADLALGYFPGTIERPVSAEEAQVIDVNSDSECVYGIDFGIGVSTTRDAGDEGG